MDVSKLKDLIDLMNDNDLLEIEIEEEGHKVRLKKKPPPGQASMPPMVVAAPGALPMPAAAAAPPALEQRTDAKSPEAGTITMTSPMVGTFYRSSNPDSDPFVDVGDEVGPDTVVCIIEAMKVMNEIKAESAGTISEVLVQNGEPVEYGQPLFVLKPRTS